MREVIRFLYHVLSLLFKVCRVLLGSRMQVFLAILDNFYERYGIFQRKISLSRFLLVAQLGVARLNIIVAVQDALHCFPVLDVGVNSLNLVGADEGLVGFDVSYFKLVVLTVGEISVLGQHFLILEPISPSARIHVLWRNLLDLIHVYQRFHVYLLEGLSSQLLAENSQFLMLNQRLSRWVFFDLPVPQFCILIRSN